MCQLLANYKYFISYRILSYHDIDNLRKRSMQTPFDFEEDVIDATTDQTAGSGHFEHMLRNECSFI